MACLDLEGTVICPQIDGIGDTGNTTLEDLQLVSAVHARHTNDNRPFLQPPYQQWRIPDQHTSSSIQREVGTWRGSGHKHREWLQWLVDSNCDSIHLRVTLRHERAFPSFRKHRYPRANRHQRISDYLRVMTTDHFVVELQDFCTFLLRSTHSRIHHKQLI